MLALTARYIPEFVAYHSSSDPSDALAASEYYAEAFAACLDAPALTVPDIGGCVVASAPGCIPPSLS
ncbi:hypothetical protein VE03_10696, partial [Pseudogymnoascus sp. 23342-1-I1]